MPAATRSEHDRQDEHLDLVFAALSNPTRRAIVRRLADGDATVSDLAGPFDMSLPAVSKHLSVLEKAGLVDRHRRGRSRYCSLRPAAVEQAEEWLTACRHFWIGTLDALAEHLDQGSPVSEGHR